MQTQAFRGHGEPPDSTNAMGPTRFIEASNLTFTIWDRNGGPPLFSGNPFQIYGQSGGDPQVVWDPQSRRFYFAALRSFFLPAGVAWGFSRTDSPNGPGDWCSYLDFFDFGNSIPDYPRLGTTADFILVGANRLGSRSQAYGTQSDLMWWAKPPAGNTCPAATSFRKGIVDNLRNTDNTEAFTPLPARQVDNDPTGWVLATHLFTGSTISAFPVTKSAAGDAIIGAVQTVPIPQYVLPDVAPQAGTGTDGRPAPPVETLDARLTQAVAAIDPRLGHLDIWTAHSVRGGAGAEVRWYEIDPARAGLDQSGTLSDANLYVFNATVAPDRAVDQTNARFGSDMVIEANTSSSTQPISMIAATKRGATPLSPFLTVKTSLAAIGSGASCAPEIRHACRWGDFSATSPDPLGSPDGTQGQIWATNTWVDSNHAGVSWNTGLIPNSTL